MNLRPEFLDKYRDKQAPMDPIGTVTFLRTYSAGGQETWFDVCKRVVEGAWTIGERRNPRGMNPEYVQHWAERMFDHMFNLRWVPAGRGLQHMGHDRMWVKGSGVLQNCGYVDSSDDDWIAFLANMSMLGVGVGFDMSGVGKHKLRTPTIAGTLAVADTREGWVDVFTRLYAAVTGKQSNVAEVIDLTGLRPKGAKLLTMGGVSSGPDPLGQAICNFCKASGVLSASYNADERKVHVAPGVAQVADLTSARILDMGNIVGVCVVSGGIRRSAEIAIFETGDDTVYEAKRDTEKLYAWRWASNNTVRFHEPPSRDEIRALVQNCYDYGDPGALFLYNVLGRGRTGDVNLRERGHGCNPCVTGDLLVNTTDGPRRVDDLVGKQFSFEHDGREWVSDERGFWETKRTDELTAVILSNGSRITCTPDHKVITTRGPVDACNLVFGDAVVEKQPLRIHVVSGDADKIRDAWAAGNFFGDGHMLRSGRKPARLEYWGAGREVYAPTVASWFPDARVTEVPSRNKITVASSTLDDRLKTYFGLSVDKSLTTSNITRLTLDEQFAFVLGWLEADGSFQGTKDKGLSIRLTSTDVEALRIAQSILHASGVYSRVYSKRKSAGFKSFGDKVYPVKEVHELVVSAYSRRVLAYLVEQAVREFALPTRFKSACKQFASQGSYKDKIDATVVSVEKITLKEPVPVYDCSVPGLNQFPANGVMVHNCGEQPLESKELCNLVEICLPRCRSYAEFEQVALCALYYGKLVTMLPTGVPESDAIMNRNRRIGVSVTGFVEDLSKLEWFDDTYSTMRKFDQRISRRHEVPTSVKITSVKPSGSVSLVLGCAPGMNAHFAPYYIRRINIEETSPLCAVLDAAGYPRERNLYSKTSYVYEFPMRATGPTGLSATQQLANVLALQANWSDNMVSNTIVFDENEIDEIADYVFEHRDKFKSLAFLKREHGFEQAPLEEITAEEYAKRAAAVRDLDLSLLHGANTHDTDEAGCESGKCVVSFGDLTTDTPA